MKPPIREPKPPDRDTRWIECCIAVLFAVCFSAGITMYQVDRSERTRHYTAGEQAAKRDVERRIAELETEVQSVRARTALIENRLGDK